MNLEMIWNLLKEFVKQAETQIPGGTGKQKKAWCIERTLEMVNAAEVMLGIASWANLPFVDTAERWIIGLGVERAWTELQMSE